MKRICTLLIASLVVVGLAVANTANAAIYGFTRITSNSSQNVASQLTMDVTDAGGGLVAFKFQNNVGIASSIADIYFDDGPLLGISSITDSGAGVAFDDPATPGNLPGGNSASPPFVTTVPFSADSDSPVTPNGVNSSAEWVTITFSLISGKTFADTIAALGSGALRAGLHVQAIGTDGKSDSFVNNVPVVVPEPASIVVWSLLGSAGVLAALRSRKRRGWSDENRQGIYDAVNRG